MPRAQEEELVGDMPRAQEEELVGDMSRAQEEELVGDMPRAQEELGDMPRAQECPSHRLIVGDKCRLLCSNSRGVGTLGQKLIAQDHLHSGCKDLSWTIEACCSG